jgi:hypothetical protein
MASDIAPLLSPRALAIIAGVVGIVLGGTIALWARYGTTVFYEMIVAGLAYCF